MTGACPASVTASAIARDVLASADCLIAAQVQQGYAALLAPGGAFATALTAALTIYVAVLGYRLLLGLTTLSVGNLVPHFVKIGIIVAVATSWPGYQTLVFDTLFHGPEEIADAVVRRTAGADADTGNVLDALQSVLTRLSDAASDAWAQTPPLRPAAPAPAPASTPPAAQPATPAAALPAVGAPQIAAVMLWLSAAVLLAASVGVLLVARIVLALLLVLGPVLIACALFRTTRGLAEGWLKVALKFALVPLFTLPLIAVAVTVLAPLTATLGDAPIVTVRDGPAPVILLVVFVFVAVMAQAARLGGGIAGALRLPRQPPPGPAQAQPTATASPTTARSSEPTRAETIVRAIDVGRRGSSPGTAAPGGVALTTVRTLGGSAVPRGAASDAAGRLGQSYRRLAVAPARAGT